MLHFSRSKTLSATFALLLMPSATALAGDVEAIHLVERKLEPMANEVIYVIRADNAFLPRRVEGEVRDDVRGVPAAPVDNFTWDGKGMKPIIGSAYAELDPVNDRGYIEITWTDEHGHWKLVQEDFSIAPLPLGIRLGPSADQQVTVSSDPVAARVYMHGDTGGVDATLPLLFATVGTWGISQVTLNGEPFENPYDGPKPDWITHTMLVSGVYDENGRVETMDGDAYSPADPGSGTTQWDDYEYQFIFLDHPGPEVEGNLPPVASFAYHLVFEDVSVGIESKGR